MGQSHGKLGFCCSGSHLLFLKAGNYLTVLGGRGCCILWPSSPQGSTSSSAPLPPAAQRSLRLSACPGSVPWRLRISLRTSVREGPRPAPCGSSSLHAFWAGRAGEGTGTAPDAGRAPGGLHSVPGSQAKSPEEEPTFPFSLEPISKTPLGTSTTPWRAHLLLLLLSSREAPGASRHPQTCPAIGQPPAAPQPTRKKPRRAAGV